MPCRLFLALQETNGPGSAWQFWYLVVSLPAEEAALARDGASAEQSSKQVMKAFEQVWGAAVRLQAARCCEYACARLSVASPSHVFQLWFLKIRTRLFHVTVMLSWCREACGCLGCLFSPDLLGATSFTVSDMP